VHYFYANQAKFQKGIRYEKFLVFIKLVFYANIYKYIIYS